MKRFGSFELLNFTKLPPKAIYSVPKAIRQPNYANVAPLDPKGPIYINTLLDIKGIRIASEIARKALNAACLHAQEGISTEEIDRIAFNEIVKHNAYPSPLGYMGFPKAICTSVNNVLCHGIPDQRKLVNGDIINIDVTVFYKGYHGDTSRTICIGNVDKQGVDLVNKTKSALDLAISVVKPGTQFKEIGSVIEYYFSK